MNFQWNDEYRKIANRAIKTHFGNSQGITSLFPYMKTNFASKKLPSRVDPRPVLKTVLEYHGLERHAKQYHLTAQYHFAFEFWTISACWRHETSHANSLDDASHQSAIEFALKNAEYNRALSEWQNVHSKLPLPEEFGLSEEIVTKQDALAEREMLQALE